MMPQTNEILEVDDALDVTNIKTQSTKQIKTQSHLASLNIKPKKPNHLSDLKTQLFSDSNNELSQSIKNIDRNDVIPFTPRTFHNELNPSMRQINGNSDVMKPLIPYDAYKNNINGWVILKLYISKVGKVVDVEVLDSSPKGIFESVAIKAAFKKVFPINKDILDPKAYTKNINIKYNAAN